MSRSYKQDTSKLIGEDGHVHHLDDAPDSQVSHSRDCWLCASGTKPKRVLLGKPRRRAEDRELAQEVEQFYQELADSPTDDLGTFYLTPYFGPTHH